MLSAINGFDAVLRDPEPVIGISEIQADGYQVELNIWLNTKTTIVHAVTGTINGSLKTSAIPAVSS